MADDDKQDDGFDPWAELESAPSPAAEGGFDFSFDDDSEPSTKGAPLPQDEAHGSEAVAEAANAADGSGDAADADDDVARWLTEPASDEPAPVPLAVFAGDDESVVADAADPEAVPVGLGESGIIEDDDAEPPADEVADVGVATPDDVVAWDDIEVESAFEPGQFGVVGAEAEDRIGDAEGGVADGGSDDDAAGIAAAAGVAVAAAGTAASPGVVRSAKRPRTKKGGLGQMIGVVLGGLLALPITFAILIWGFRKDPLHLVRHVPDSMAFLFPQELVPGGSRPAGVATGPTLDDVPAMAGGGEDAAATEEPVAEPATDTEIATDAGPAPAALVDAAAGDVPSDPLMVAADASAVAPGDAVPEPSSDPSVAAPVAVAEPGAADDAPGVTVDPFGDLAPVMPTPTEPLATSPPPVEEPPAPPQPEPLDLSGVEIAVAAADDAYRAVEAAGVEADPDPVRQARRRNRLLVDWYRQVAVVAEELAALERVAADTGRPLDGPPEPVARLQAAAVGDEARLDDLARLSRDWLAYQGRSSSGIVMPAVLAGVRHVGPYWCTTVTVSDAGDRSRDIVVISRSEPTAAPGDAVLVTGLIVDGDTLWASDVRRAAGDAPTTIDPFAAPAP